MHPSFLSLCLLIDQRNTEVPSSKVPSSKVTSMLEKLITFFPRNMLLSDQIVSVNYLGSIITHQYENSFDALLY